MPRKKTHEEFVKEVIEIRGDIYDFLSEYVVNKIKITTRHRECGHIWNASPSKLLNKKQNGKIHCPICNGGVRITHEEFVNNIISNIGDIYEFLTKYESDAKPITIKHKSCGYIWSPKANSLATNSKKCKITCPQCNGGMPHNLETFKSNVFKLVKDEYIVLGEYINANVPIKMKHSIDECGYEFEPRPTAFINAGSRCPKCSGCLKKNTEQFKSEVYELVGNEYKVLGDYVNSSTKIKMFHAICGMEFNKSPNKFINCDQRCPYCANKSKGENKIFKFLSDNEIVFQKEYKFDNCKNIVPLPFDCAIFDNKGKLHSLIEYDGQQHFEPVDFANKGADWANEQFELTKYKDKIRNEYCKENNIKLYRIPYWSYNEVEKILDKIIHNQPIEVDETSFLVQL